MCHTTDYYHHRHRLTTSLKSITLHLSLSSSSSSSSSTLSLLPDTLTFVFLPRINGTPLHINSSTFPSDSPAFLSLHRLSLHSSVFTSHDRLSFHHGAVFEVHFGHNRLLHGVFRHSKIDCKCLSDTHFGIEEVEITAALQNGSLMREKVKVAVTEAKRRRFCRKYDVALMEIPEERECDVEDDGVEWCSCCGEDDDETDGGDEIDEDRRKMMMMMEMEMEMEGVKWAFDIGIWAVCIGVGLLVSKASLSSLRRRNKFLL